MINNFDQRVKLNYLQKKSLTRYAPMGWAGPRSVNPWADFHRPSSVHSELYYLIFSVRKDLMFVKDALS